MNLFRLIAITVASATMIGCSTTQDPQARAKIGMLREGMSQAQVKRIFGQPNKVDHDDGHHRGYHPYGYYGWRGYGRDEEEVTWEYDAYNLEVKFRRARSGWVVKEWEN
jgi:hypothetical protein